MAMKADDGRETSSVQVHSRRLASRCPESTQSREVSWGAPRLESARHTATEGPQLLLGWEGPGRRRDSVVGVSKHGYSWGESPVKSVVTVQAPGSSVAKAAVLICRTGQWAPFSFLPLRI